MGHICLALYGRVPEGYCDYGFGEESSLWSEDDNSFCNLCWIKYLYVEPLAKCWRQHESVGLKGVKKGAEGWYAACAQTLP
jgi:hypothetical protein